MPGKPFGRHVLVTIPRIPAQHGAWVDVAQAEWTVTRRCLVVPVPVPIELQVHGRTQESAQWSLYAPPGYRATGDAQAQVLLEDGSPFVPDPSDPTAPVRLEFAYTPRPVANRAGVERYVDGMLRLLSVVQSPRR